MKKLMMLMLGLSLAFGSVAAVYGQDKKDDTKKSSKKKGRKEEGRDPQERRRHPLSLSQLLGRRVARLRKTYAAIQCRLPDPLPPAPSWCKPLFIRRLLVRVPARAADAV